MTRSLHHPDKSRNTVLGKDSPRKNKPEPVMAIDRHTGRNGGMKLGLSHGIGTSVHTILTVSLNLEYITLILNAQAAIAKYI